MRYDEAYFDAGLYRKGTRCEKWDMCEREHGEGVLPMWVADMDFPSPPEVQQAILARAAHPTYGYTEPLEDDYQALMGFWQRRHGLALQQEDIMLLPCVVTGLKLAIQALTAPGDGVMILSPVYGPFRMSVEATGRTLMDVHLTRDDRGRYGLDLAAMEAAMQRGAKLLMLCNPHNPVSRCWTREELQSVLDLANRYGVPVVSDEIHADFVYAPHRFTPVLSLQTENIVSLCAASKTFNLAGLQQAACLCRDVAIREKLQAQLNASGVTCGNIFALEATRAAYQHGDAWLDGLLDYLQGNIRTLESAVEELLPKAVLTPMEATYLGWLDLRAYGFTTEELMKKCEKAGVVFTGGTFFGQDTGDGFLRINLGCPRAYVPEAIRRLKKALEA